MGDSRPWARVIEIAAILAILGFVAVEIMLDYRRSVESARAEAQRMQAVVSANVAQAFGTLDLVLDGLTREALHHDDPAVLSRLLRVHRRGQPFVTSLFILDPSGRLVAHSEMPVDELGRYDAVPPFVSQLAADNRRMLVSAPMPASQQPAAWPASRRIWPNISGR